ncbi:MAG TPA: carboxypeptidase-like regulatory domain-containing protein [Thermoanaerobaculia bacterium]|nr:carboxypeptidase-like regulatory domain-containing protein [Thermoanaerobaculia bacterium]
MRKRAMIALLFLTGPSLLAGDASHIQLFSVEKGTKPSCRGGQLRAVQRCSGAGCGDHLAVTGSWTFRDGSAEAELALSPDVSWEIAIEGSGCWAPPIIIAAGNAGETKTSFVWPSAAIGGDFVMPKGGAPPNDLHGSVQADDPHNPTESIAEAPLDCSVDGPHWRCLVPSAVIDLRLASDGFVPQYLWGLRVPAGQQKALALSLTKGASVSGRVSLADRRTPLGEVAIELHPAGFATKPTDERRLASLARTVKPNARGFFQFPEVGEGTYEVIATKKGWSPATHRVRVSSANETDAGLLLLPPLARAEVIIDPPLDPKGRPWRIVLDRDAVPMRPLAPIADARAATDGTWAHDGVEAGKYRLEIFDGDGIAYEHLLVTIEPNGSPLRLQMEANLVRGTVHIGHDPLEATLHFMNRRGPGDLKLTSSHDGTFAGTFPAWGTYDVEIQPEKTEQKLRRQVEVKPSSEGVAQLDIALPGGAVHGLVVDETGTPVAGVVRLYHREGGSMISTMTAEDGTFHLIAIDPGDAVLSARSRTVGDSGPVPYNVVEDASEPVTLTLHARRDVTMWVVSPTGQPISGAVVRFSNRYYWHEEVTGPGGDATFSVPRGVDAIDVIIAAAGYPMRLMTLAISPEMETNPQIALGSATSLLVLSVGNSPPWPALAPANAGFRLHWLPEFFGSPAGGPHSPNSTPRGFEFELDPGTYTLCPAIQVSPKCIQRTLAPGTETVVDVSSWSSQGATR